jgi:hypothetical protein
MDPTCMWHQLHISGLEAGATFTLAYGGHFDRSRATMRDLEIVREL